LITIYDIWPGNEAGPILTARSQHGAAQIFKMDHMNTWVLTIVSLWRKFESINLIQCKIQKFKNRHITDHSHFRSNSSPLD